MPNFVKIGQSVAKILKFFYFLKMAARPASVAQRARAVGAAVQ